MEPNKPEVRGPPSPPQAYRWSQGLTYLLEDQDGARLFREFLQQENHEVASLNLWLATRGLKYMDQDKVLKSARVMEKLVRKLRLPIQQSIKDDISRKVQSGDVDVHMFDAAKEVVEEYMQSATYPNFLKSDLYIQQLEPQRGGVEEMEAAAGADPLPTLHEGKELSSFSRRFGNFTSNLRKPKKVTKSKTEAQAGFSKSPSAPYHTKYSSFLPASAQDSEVQSLSSQSNSSMSDLPIPKIRPKFQQNNKLYKFIINKDDDLHTLSTFTPRTSQPHCFQQAVDHTQPELFAEDLRNRLLKAQEELKSGERFREKMGAVEGTNDGQKPDACIRQKFHYVPEEDNDQAILDQHISMVFPETPSACATPPAPKCTEEGPRQALRCPADSTLPAAADGKAAPSPFSVPFSGWVKREPDTISFDSGALTDWNSEDNPRQYHRSSELEGGASYDCQAKRKLNKSKKLSNLTGSNSSFFDSGVSTTCESVQLVRTKVTNYTETKRCGSESENSHQGKASPVLSRSSYGRKGLACGRSGAPEGVSSQYPVWPVEAAMASHDTTANLHDVKRMLENEKIKMGKSKYLSASKNSHDISRGKISSRAFDSLEDGISHRKQSKKSYAGSDSGAPSSSDMTVIGYCYGLDSVPFKSKLPGKNITLRQFKTLLNKRGNFRYFFKSLSDDFGTRVVLDEVTDDHEVLPLWEGKVFGIIEAVDGHTANDD